VRPLRSESSEPEWRNPGEGAGRAAGDGEVDEIAEVAVEDTGRDRGAIGAGGVALRGGAGPLGGAGEGADQRECREVDPDRAQAPAPCRIEEAGDHVTAGGDHRDVHLAAALPVFEAAQDLVVEHRMVDRHRQLVLGLEADRGLEIALVLDQRQAQDPHREALVGDADPDLARQLVAREERAQRRAEPLRVDHLAVVEEARLERDDAGGPESGRSVQLNLGRSGAAGLDIEPDHGGDLLHRELGNSHGDAGDLAWTRD